MVERNKWMLIGLLIWYLGLSLWAAYAPADRSFLALGECAAGVIRLNPCGHTSTGAAVAHILSTDYAVSYAPYNRNALHLCPDAGWSLA